MAENPEIETTPLSELEIENGSLVPDLYRRGRGAERKSTSVCVEVDDDLNLFSDESGTIKREHPRAKKAFEDYINLGPTRSLERLTRNYIDPDVEEWTNNYESVLRQLKRYSTQFDWQNRLRMLLTQTAGRALAEARQEQANSRRGRLTLAKKLQDTGETLIEKAHRFLEMNLETMSDKDANTLLKTAVTMLDIGLAAERVEIGETMENIMPPKPVSAMNDEELAEFIKVLTAQVN